MHVEVNGTRLWFDVEGVALVPDGSGMRSRPTLVLLHGGPGGWDHSYFKPDFSRLAEGAQVVYLDLRDHGRSGRGDPAAWTFELCADDVRAFADALGIEHPIVLGHSMGGFVAMLYGARHPGHAAGLILLSTFGRFDLERLVEAVRRAGGDLAADIARRSYGGLGEVSPDEWELVFRTFGPHRPAPDAMARRVRNLAVSEPGMDRLRHFDVLDLLPQITAPTLVVTGALDAITPPAASREIVANLAPGIGRLEILDGAGHFSWLDAPERLFGLLAEFCAAAS